YSDKSQEELERIISSEGDYTELAKKAARDVLNSDRTEYYQKITEQVNKEKAVTQKIEFTQNHPLYHDIHEIVGDIRFMRNLIIAGLAICFIFGIIDGFLVF
ncbi:hypothetical protein, partial [Eisenbergiella massiliensis]|uniref:hypothetical protein n=1 Tax=Eisenbergiella massiliensis TaxID=1720294 RepID=UPI002490C491